MSTFSYNGTAYRQTIDQNAPWIINFVASAEEILRWAGIPRRSDDKLVGFQRPFDPDRIEKAKEFFQEPPNQSPTSLVLGIHPVPNNTQRTAVLEFLDDNEENTIRQCKLTITFDDETLNSEKVVDLVKNKIQHRINTNGESHLDFNDPEDFLDSQSLDEEVDNEDQIDSSFTEHIVLDNTNETNGEVELGRSVLNKLLIKLDDKDWVDSEIDALKDIAKPATVIDGQHRVKGAQACERNIPFAVCAIYDCEWSEQVFQFTVVNYTQKGIPDQFITANAALSLTGEELDGLKNRLFQAGVKVIEYDLMKVVNFDPSSPFYNLVNLSEKPSSNKIGYKTMVRIAKAWYSAKQPFFQQLLINLYPDIKGGSAAAKSQRIHRWKEDDWGKFFIDFWQLVQKNYSRHSSHIEGYNLWDIGHSNLIIAIVLFEFQAAFFGNLDQQDEEFFDVKNDEKSLEELRDKLQTRASKFVAWFPPEFFSTKWGTSSLNTGAGKSALQQAFSQFVVKKGHYQYKNSTLVTGQSSV